MHMEKTYQVWKMGKAVHTQRFMQEELESFYHFNCNNFKSLMSSQIFERYLLSDYVTAKYKTVVEQYRCQKCNKCF